MSQNAIDVIKLELTLSERAIGNTIPKCNANVTPSVLAQKFVVARISL